MHIWRICAAKYQDSAFSGVGGLYVPGRWHFQGHRIIYTAESLALRVKFLRFNCSVATKLLPLTISVATLCCQSCLCLATFDCIKDTALFAFFQRRDALIFFFQFGVRFLLLFLAI